MDETRLPRIRERVAEQRGETALTPEVTTIENGREEHIRGEVRAGMLEVKGREFLGKAANAVADTIQTDGEQRYIAAVDRNRKIRDAERPEEDQEEIGAFLKEGQKLRASTFGQIASIAAEEVATAALRPFPKYTPPPEPVARQVPPPEPKNTVVVVTKGNLVRPDKVEKFEV